MKKFILLSAAALLVFSLTACGSPASPADPSGFISLTSEITELESGLSAVRYEGDYGFDLFLEQGGADSDEAVVQFLMENLLGNTGLQFGGGAFGCSTVSVPNADGDLLSSGKLREKLRLCCAMPSAEWIGSAKLNCLDTIIALKRSCSHGN